MSRGASPRRPSRGLFSRRIASRTARPRRTAYEGEVRLPPVEEIAGNPLDAFGGHGVEAAEKVVGLLDLVLEDLAQEAGHGSDAVDGDRVGDA